MSASLQQSHWCVQNISLASVNQQTTQCAVYTRSHNSSFSLMSRFFIVTKKTLYNKYGQNIYYLIFFPVKMSLNLNIITSDFQRLKATTITFTASETLILHLT